MIQTVDAIFEDGVLKPLQKLELHEHAQVRVTVEPVGTSQNGLQSSSTEDPLEGLRVATGITDLAENFDDYRFGRRKP
ncbi:MAG TPA: antitoxin family protein [Planctomycetaceae bacterium]|nr:antitoxin family protein [Planctomycetaceae bacterium]